MRVPTSELQACKLTLKLWQDMFQSFTENMRAKFIVKRECSDILGGFMFNCPCCAFAGLDYDNTNPRCGVCPMKDFWTSHKVEEHHCFEKDSPYNSFSDAVYSEEVEVAIEEVIELCKEAIEYWKSMKEMNQC